MSTPAAPACRNCGTPAGGKFCPECGQTTALHPPSAREFFQELLENQVALNGAIWKTLRKLVNPGQLTLEFLAGRRRRYVPPLRLYLTASLIFFLVAKVITPSANVAVKFNGSVAGEGPVALQCDAGDSFCATLEKRLRDHFTGMTRKQAGDFMAERVVSTFPYAMFFLVPLFALLTRTAYWRRPFNYGEHLVFAFHVHAFVFLLGAIVAPFATPMLVTVPAAIYLVVAMQTVFGGRKWVNIARFILVFLVYSLILTFSIALAFAAAAIL